MKPLAYYNENDPYAAQWLRYLVSENLIAQGDVDERSIADVRPDDVTGYRQCHWFAGVGGWSIAARLAGWPDSRELWTGSAPCQPFSVAGEGKGFGDDRDLWPHYFRLIKACRPDVAMGEQVHAAIRKHWLDRVFDDLEGIDYACEAISVPACAVNAPQRRDRVWFIAESPADRRARAADNRERAGLEGHAGHDSAARGWPQQDRSAAATGRGTGGNYINPKCCDRDTRFSDEKCFCCGYFGRPESSTASFWFCENCGSRSSFCISCPALDGSSMADTNQPIISEQRQQSSGQLGGIGGDPTNSYWHNADWIIGHDNKARRIPSAESGICLLVNGLSPWVAGMRASGQTASRQVALKGFGNAIVPAVAAEIIRAYMDCAPVVEQAA